MSVDGEVHGDGVFVAVKDGMVRQRADEGKTTLRLFGVSGSVPAAGVGNRDAYQVVIELGL